MLEAEADALLDFTLGNKRPFHSIVEPHRPSDASSLRVVHRDVGTAQKIGDARFRRAGGRYSYERSDLDHSLVDHCLGRVTILRMLSARLSAWPRPLHLGRGPQRTRRRRGAQ